MTPFFKAFLWVVFCIVIWALSGKVFAITPDELVHGEKVATGKCVTTQGTTTPCIRMKYKEREYLVILDWSYTATVIYDVTGKATPYDMLGVTPVWMKRQGKET